MMIRKCVERGFNAIMMSIFDASTMTTMSGDQK